MSKKNPTSGCDGKDKNIFLSAGLFYECFSLYWREVTDQNLRYPDMHLIPLRDF